MNEFRKFANPFRRRAKGGADRRVLAVGDIHGCALELRHLLEKLAPSRDDLVIFLGDYVDRGPDSRQVIDQIIELGTKCEVVALWGNHERMFIDFLDQPASTGAGMFILNGGSSTLASYAGPGGSFEIPDSHLRFFHQLKYFHETETHFFVHAGLPDLPLKALSLEEHASHMLWTRDPFLKSTFDWGKVVVHGHTPVAKPEVKANRINIDTGCVYDGQLTAIDVTAMKFYHVDKVKKGTQPAPAQELPSYRTALRFEGRLPVLAARVGEALQKYETLNFNQFGLLLTEVVGQPSAVFSVGDRIEGTIGPNRENEIRFVGEVVRAEARTGTPMYGIKLERVSAIADGYHWIERPEGRGTGT